MKIQEIRSCFLLVTQDVSRYRHFFTVIIPLTYLSRENIKNFPFNQTENNTLLNRGLMLFFCKYEYSNNCNYFTFTYLLFNGEIVSAFKRRESTENILYFITSLVFLSVAMSNGSKKQFHACISVNIRKIIIQVTELSMLLLFQC